MLNNMPFKLWSRSFLSAFIRGYQVSGIRSQTKSYRMIQTIKSSQLHLWNAPWEVSSCAVQCLRLFFLYITYIIFKNLQQTIKVRLNLGWSTFDTWKLSPRLLPWCCVNSTKNKRGKGVVCACNKQSAAKAAVPGCSIALQKCCIMFTVVLKNKSNMQLFKHLVA